MTKLVEALQDLLTTDPGHGAKMEADEAEPLKRDTLFSTHVDCEIIYIDNDAPA